LRHVFVCRRRYGATGFSRFCSEAGALISIDGGVACNDLAK
jgi:hypothetical protein